MKSFLLSGKGAGIAMAMFRVPSVAFRGSSGRNGFGGDEIVRLCGPEEDEAAVEVGRIGKR